METWESWWAEVVRNPLGLMKPALREAYEHGRTAGIREAAWEARLAHDELAARRIEALGDRGQRSEDGGQRAGVTGRQS
jgi:hypothetical protein